MNILTRIVFIQEMTVPLLPLTPQNVASFVFFVIIFCNLESGSFRMSKNEICFFCLHRKIPKTSLKFSTMSLASKSTLKVFILQNQLCFFYAA